MGGADLDIDCHGFDCRTIPHEDNMIANALIESLNGLAWKIIGICLVIVGGMMKFDAIKKCHELYEKVFA